MDAASQNSSFLLASLISGQGAGMSVGSASQAVDNTAESGGASFLSSLNQSTQELQFVAGSPAMPPDMDALLQAVNKLLAGNAATMGNELPLADGNGFAADMSNEDLLSFISQLQGEGAEALAEQLTSLLQGQAGGAAGNEDVLSSLQGEGTESLEGQLASLLQGRAGMSGSEVTAQEQHRQKVDALFAKVRQLIENTASSDPLSQLSQATMANIEVVDQLAAQSQLGDRRLLERLNAILPQQSQAAEAAKVDVNLRQPLAEPGLALVAENSDSVSNTVVARDLTTNAVVTPIPVLLERMVAASNGHQPNTDLSDWSESADVQASIAQLGKAIGSQANSVSRPVSSFIQAPLTAPQWQTEFSDKVMMMSRVASQGQNQVAEIRLNPAHMGPIEVRVVMKDDQASITFSAQHGVVRDAIETSLPRLREMFNNSGMMLADASVSEHSLQERQQQKQQSGSGEQYGRADSGVAANEQATLISQIDLSAMSSPMALDLYA